MCEYDTIYAETKPAAGEDRVLVDSCVYRILKVGNVRHRVKVTDCRWEHCPNSYMYIPPRQ